jgi:3-methyladenine DNA glycosylase AlkD
VATSSISSNGRPDRIGAEVARTLAWLKRRGTKAGRDGMARYAIVSDKAFGVSVGTLRQLAKKLGRNHELAASLWDTGWYEARMLASLIDEPEKVTPAQMDRWSNDFDNWAICDTVCFHLFDRTPHAFTHVAKWSRRREEFVKRGAFALLASLALHDKTSADRKFLRCLPLIEREAEDERNFVKKSVSWALRAIGERTTDLHDKATAVARRLAASTDKTARWVGKDALRQLATPAVARRLASRTERAARKARPSE